MSSLRFTFASADAHPVRTVYTFTSPPVVLRLWTVRLRPKSLLTYGGPRSPPLSGTRSAACTKNPQCGTPPAPCRELVREEGPTVATTAPPLSPEPGPHEPHSHKRGAKRSAAVVHVAQALDRTGHHRHRTQRQRSAQGGGRLRTASRKTNALQVNGLRRSSPQERTRAKRLQRLHTQTTRNDARNSQHNID